jgi:hypothetical protein
MAALQAARAAGLGVSAYAKAHGLNARQVHDSIAALRRRGALPPTDCPRPRKSAFVAVRMANTPRSSSAVASPPRTGMVCRLVCASGLVIECGDRPPAAWLMSLTSGHRDAAS